MKYIRTLLALFLVVPASEGAILNLGLLSFDVLVPGEPGSPGVNSFTILNFTGDPGLGGFALNPDFPSFTPVVFLSSTLTLFTGSGTLVVPLGDLSPGVHNPGALQFPGTDLFSSATFTALLSETTLTLADGSTFVAGGPLLEATLFPGSGGPLVPGSDLVVLTASDVPEPATLGIALAAILLLFTRNLARSRRA